MATASRLGILFAFFVCLTSSCRTVEQDRPAKEDLPFLLGSAEEARLSTDQASLESRGTLRLLAFGDRQTVYTDLRSGRTLTLRALLERTAAAFASAAGAPSGRQLGKVGAASHGGEAVFVADGRGGVAVVFDGNSAGAAEFNADQVRTLRELMGRAR